MRPGDEEVEQAARFMHANLESYEQLAVLGLLAHASDRSWTAAAVAQELGIALAEAARALDHLCARNLLDIRIGDELHFRYGPGVPALREESGAFLRALDRHPMALARLMTDHQRERERSPTLRAFVDAFLLRGPGK